MNSQPSLATIEKFLDEMSKSAEANTEPGSQGGETTHPIKNVDDNTQDAPLGARAKENEKDVKADQGKPSVDSTPEAKAKKAAEGDAGGTAKEDQLQIGTKKAPTGEDPANETSSAKATKDDSQTAHPARTDNDALNGGKYACNLETDSLQKLASVASVLGDEICAALVVDEPKTACDAGSGGLKPAQPSKPEKPAEADKPAAPAKSAAETKLAADQRVQTRLAEIIKAACATADDVADYLDSYQTAKQANPFGAGPGGMPPAAGAGGPPSGAPEPDGDEAQGGGEDAQLQQLQQMLEELGITPEELEQALSEQSGGGEAGGAGGPPTPPPAGAAPGGAGPAGPGGPGMEVAASAKQPPAVAKEAANYVKELVGRYRAKRAAAAK